MNASTLANTLGKCAVEELYDLLAESFDNLPSAELKTIFDNWKNPVDGGLIAYLRGYKLPQDQTIEVHALLSSNITCEWEYVKTDEGSKQMEWVEVGFNPIESC